MPIIKSAKKRVKQTATATARNLRVKRTLREAVKSFTATLSGGKKADIDKAQSSAFSAIDTAVKKNLMSKQRAARKKSQLNAAAKKASGATKATTVKPAKKAAPAKTTAKKSPAKKAAAKPAAKKTATTK